MECHPNCQKTSLASLRRKLTTHYKYGWDVFCGANFVELLNWLWCGAVALCVGCCRSIDVLVVVLRRLRCCQCEMSDLCWGVTWRSIESRERNRFPIFFLIVDYALGFKSSVPRFHAIARVWAASADFFLATRCCWRNLVLVFWGVRQMHQTATLCCWAAIVIGFVRLELHNLLRLTTVASEMFDLPVSAISVCRQLNFTTRLEHARMQSSCSLLIDKCHCQSKFLKVAKIINVITRDHFDCSLYAVELFTSIWPIRAVCGARPDLCGCMTTFHNFWLMPVEVCVFSFNG